MRGREEGGGGVGVGGRRGEGGKGGGRGREEGKEAKRREVTPDLYTSWVDKGHCHKA